MRRAIKDKRRYLFVSCFSLAGAIALTVLAVMFFLKTVYAPMIIFAVISGLCYYVSVFAFFSYLDAKAAIELLDIMDLYENGRRMSAAEVADELCWSKRAAKKFLEKCRKRGYLRY